MTFKDDSIENSNTILDESSIEKIKCYYCEEYFTKQKMLKEHAQLHSIDGNFPCKDCDKKLPTYKKLIHHNLNQHTSYTCAKCQKVLPGKQVYDNHKKACHVDKSIKMFKCDQVRFDKISSDENFESILKFYIISIPVMAFWVWDTKFVRMINKCVQRKMLN